LQTEALSISSTGDISFYEDTGTTPKFFWDSSAEALGIGTTSPSDQLHLASLDPYIRLQDTLTNAYARFLFGQSGNLELDANPDSTGTDGRIVFKVDGTEAMRITDAGNVGINDPNPAEISSNATTLNIKGKVNTKSGAIILDTADESVRMFAYATDTGAQIGTLTNDPLKFTINSGEVARIDSNGNLLVGTTSIAIDPGVQIFGAGNIFTHIAGTAGADSMRFYRDNADVGSITTTGTTTTYNTSSDARLKENIADAEDASSLVDAIKVRQFDWKADGSHQRYGMVAQELSTVAPEAVSGDPESDDMMGVDYSKLVPMLVKEIQSLRARVAQLEGA